MKAPTQFSNFPRLRRNPGLAEIKGLLEVLPKAAILVDSKNDRVLFANAKASELTTFTRPELKDVKFESLFTKYEEATDGGSMSGENHTENLFLSRRNNTELEVLTTRYDLSPHGKWTLITLEPTDVLLLREAERQQRSDLLESMQLFSLALQETDLNNALELFLQAIQKLTGAGTLSIYLHDLTTDNQDFEVVRYAHFGPPENLPKRLPTLELAQLRTSTFWSTRKRISSSLHRTARQAGLSYVASSPLGKPSALIGLIVIAGDQIPTEEPILSLLPIFAEAITALVEQHIRESNLANDRNDQFWMNAIHQTVENAVFDGVIVLTPELVISRMNHAAESILNYSNLEVQGHAVEDILIGTETLMPALYAALQGNQTLNQGNIRLYRRSGQAFLAQVSTIPTKVDDKLLGIVILIQDLSEQEQIQAQTQELERRALLGEVTAIFAHEVRNPINNLSTGLQLMAYNLAEDDPNQEIIGRLKQDCDRLSALMKSVLSYSRPAEYEMEAVDLSLLIDRLVNRARPRMANANVEPHLQIDTPSPPIEGNPRALEQVFTNLINNAIQAMNETGGTLAIKIQKIEGTGDRQYIQVDVADNGPGIPKEHLDNIFQPFFTTKSDGTGLGLAITKRIITSHKGNIRVTSFPGGTVFHVQLPAMEER